MKLKRFSLKSMSDLLTDKQLKMVMGGSGGGGGGFPCQQFNLGTCGFRGVNGYCVCGLPYEAVQNMYNDQGGYWCCDSCDISTYFGN